jgi:hypothetical protein
MDYGYLVVECECHVLIILCGNKEDVDGREVNFKHE